MSLITRADYGTRNTYQNIDRDPQAYYNQGHLDRSERITVGNQPTTVPVQKPTLSEDVALLERFKKYRNVIVKNDSQIFEAATRCWRYYHNYWDEFSRAVNNYFQSRFKLEGDVMEGDYILYEKDLLDHLHEQSKQGLINNNYYDGYKIEKEKWINKGYSEAIKLSSKILWSLDDIIWSKHVYKKIKTYKSFLSQNIDGQDTNTINQNEQHLTKLDEIIRQSQGFYHEQLLFIRMIRETMQQNSVLKTIGDFHIEERLKKIEYKTKLHLGDLSRYVGTYEALLTANSQYLDILHSTQYESGFALNQLASVETQLFEKYGIKRSQKFALALYCLGGLAVDEFKGSEANMKRLEDILGDYNLVSVDILKKFLAMDGDPEDPVSQLGFNQFYSFFDGVYISYKYPIETMTLMANYICLGFDKFVNSIEQLVNQNQKEIDEYQKKYKIWQQKQNGGSSEDKNGFENIENGDSQVPAKKAGFKVAKGGLAMKFGGAKGKSGGKSNSSTVGVGTLRFHGANYIFFL